MPDFGEVREQPCDRCGGRVVYRYGNWHCGKYIETDPPLLGCGWSSRQEIAAGTVTLEHCPSCGARIIYNGNYFCEDYGSSCGWALPHPARKKADQRLAMSLVGEKN